MNSRMRSPSYPSAGLLEAIETIAKLHKSARTNPVDREVAAKELGYTGLSGRSATVLSNLIQYGLLEKSGKNEVRVSGRAVQILHPDTEAAKTNAIHEAAAEPELFQRVMDRFTDGLPSTNALHSFFVKEGLTDTAIPSAIRAFQETFAFVAENTNVSGSHSSGSSGAVESLTNQRSEQGIPRVITRQTGSAHVIPDHASKVKEMPEYRFFDDKIWLGGVVANQEQARKLVEFINAVSHLLRKAAPTDEASASETALPVTGPNE